jgi:hypothetical protein
MFYMDVRYEGGTHSVTGFAEPDLRLTDDRALISASNTGSNTSIAYMGILSVLLAWHQSDPPDAEELRRNDVVFGAQGNRNPFVDHPEWVALLYGGPVAGSFANYGAGCGVPPASAPQLLGNGQPLIGQNYVLSLLGAPTDSPAVLQLDVAQRAIDLGPFGFAGCTALTLPTLSTTATTSPLGTLNAFLPVPAQNGLVGQAVHAQWIVFDPVALGLATSNGGTLTFGRL